MDIDKNLFGIIEDELGIRSADLFARFFGGFSKKEQLDGAKEILVLAVGVARTKELLERIEKK